MSREKNEIEIELTTLAEMKIARSFITMLNIRAGRQVNFDEIVSCQRHPTQDAFVIKLKVGAQ